MGPEFLVLGPGSWHFFHIYFKGSLPLYRSTLHAIGHVLGLQHVPEIDSLMNPLFKVTINRENLVWEFYNFILLILFQSANRFQKVFAIPLQDNIALRKLYGGYF